MDRNPRHRDRERTLPRSRETSASRRHNALTHGLRASTVLVPGESKAVWRRFHDTIVGELAPETPLECELATKIAALSWRLRRVPRAEAALAYPGAPEVDDMAASLERATRHLAAQFLPMDQVGEEERDLPGPATPGARARGNAPITQLLSPSQHSLQLIVRYEAHLSRQHYSAMTYYAALRNARKRAEVSDDAPT